ncbi:MATE family efflux transporter [Blautia sp.]
MGYDPFTVSLCPVQSDRRAEKLSGTAAVAGYTAASKADQVSVLVNNAMMTAIFNYVAQNFGAGKSDRIHQGVRACLIQTETLNLIMCVGILLLRHPIVQMFLSNPTKEIYHYSDMYLTVVAPFYFILGLLAVYRTSIQSMQNGQAPFAACMIELVMRIAATVGLSGMIGYTSVCIASPLAWIGACSLLIPVYYKMMRRA